MKRLLMGNEAIALGAIRAGVGLASGYPGTPSSEILETIAKEAPEGVYCEWSVNEKAALEVAAGASIAGMRSLATMKQVGLNVASDPLMSLNYVGVKAGMVVVAADDPGPISSQTEQDTRRFGEFAKICVFDPSSPEEAYIMVAEAFEVSEEIGRPVILRPTTRVCHSYASVGLLPAISRRQPEGFSKDDGRWVIFPKLSYQNHLLIESGIDRLSSEFSGASGNVLSGAGRKGIAAGGVSWLYVNEVLNGGEECKLLKVATSPFPANLGAEFLDGLDEVLVIEELDTVIEDSLLKICGEKHLPAAIRGKRTGDMPRAGENTVSQIGEAVAMFLALDGQEGRKPEYGEMPALAIRPPVLCAGCPHRAAFFAVKEAAKGRKAVFSGDIGCYTLGNAPPLNMVDTCLCMGAGITQAQGLNRADPSAVNFAFIGDSTFFHSGVTGVINAVYNGADIIVAILDNRTTAMTGGQAHPGTGKTLMGGAAPRIDIYEIVKAIGVKDVQRVGAFDLNACKEAVKRAMDNSGVRVLIFEGACISDAPKKPAIVIDNEKCVGCAACVKRLGCPALSMRGGKAVADPVTCTGCGLCAHLCPSKAIGGRKG